MSLKIILSLLLISAILGGSFFFPRVTNIKVSGNRHLSPLEVMELAGVRKDNPWLWYGVTSHAQAALSSPWVQSMKVARVFPSSVEITLTERTPYARLKRDGGIMALAQDGTVLPGGALVGPLISGWGRDRRLEALEVVAALEGYGVTGIRYASSGLRISSTKGSLWVESLNSLYRYASLLATLESGTEGKMTYIYPWGVSVQQ